MAFLSCFLLHFLAPTISTTTLLWLSSNQPIRSQEARSDNDTDSLVIIFPCLKGARQFCQCFCCWAAVCELKVLFLQLLLSSLTWLRGEWESQTALLRTVLMSKKKDWNWEIVRNIYFWLKLSASVARLEINFNFNI